MWTCPKCHSKVDAEFEVCWSCGTSKDGVEDPSFVRADDVPPEALDAPDAIAEPEPLAPDAAQGAPMGDLVECYLALDIMQARFLADRLSEQGIPAIADTEDMHAELGSMNSGPRVWVRAADLARARAWLEDYDRQFKAEHGQPG